MHILKALSDKVLPALFWFFLMLAFDTAAMTVMTCLAAAIHELGHIAAGIILTGDELSLPKATLTGLKIHTGRLLSYKEETIIAASGPLVNIVVFLFALPFFNLSGYIAAFAFINLLTAVSNLIPIKSYDGYRIISASLAGRLEPCLQARVMSALTLVFSAAAVLISLVLLMLIGEGYWLFAIFFAILIKEILKLHEKDKK